MARPKTDALLYFNIDVKEDDNLKYIEALYGHIGYYVVHKLWKHIYGGPGGYYCEWGEINQRLFCKENAISIDKLKEIIETCFSDDVKLFNREMYLQHKILTSTGLQKRWKKIVTEAGRKNCTINTVYSLINTPAVVFPPLQITPAVLLSGGLSVGNGGLNGLETTQSKVKESKVKESKLSSTTVGKSKKETFPAPATAGPSRFFWQDMVDCWFDFYRGKFSGEEPNFKGRNPKWFEKIYDLLQARATKKKKEWTAEYGLSALKMFLETAHKDDWLQKHFLLENIHNQFDSIIARATDATKKKNTGPVSLEDELKYIVSRVNEGDFDDRVIVTGEYYDKLVARGYLKIGMLEKTEGDNLEEKKLKLAKRWFKTQAEALISQPVN